jgi:hypothetical protein
MGALHDAAEGVFLADSLTTRRSRAAFRSCSHNDCFRNWSGSIYLFLFARKTNCDLSTIWKTVDLLEKRRGVSAAKAY